MPGFLCWQGWGGLCQRHPPPTTRNTSTCSLLCMVRFLGSLIVVLGHKDVIGHPRPEAVFAHRG